MRASGFHLRRMAQLSARPFSMWLPLTPPAASLPWGCTPPLTSWPPLLADPNSIPQSPFPLVRITRSFRSGTTAAGHPAPLSTLLWAAVEAAAPAVPKVRPFSSFSVTAANGKGLACLNLTTCHAKIAGVQSLGGWVQGRAIPRVVVTQLRPR